MPATINIVQNSGFSGGNPVDEEVHNSASNLLSIDDANGSKSANPVRIPTAGTTYSFETWLRLKCAVAPAVSVDNIKVWYVSGLAAGYVITINSTAVSVYAAPVDTISTAGTRVAFSTKNSEGNSVAVAGTLEDVGDYSDWIVFQLEVGTTASPGTTFSVSYIIQYDEV